MVKKQGKKPKNNKLIFPFLYVIIYKEFLKTHHIFGAFFIYKKRKKYESTNSNKKRF